MSGYNESMLPSRTVQSHIEEIVHLANKLAEDYEIGTPPEEMVTSVVGIREFGFRLLGHLNEVMKAPRVCRPNIPVGFSVPCREDDKRPNGSFSVTAPKNRCVTDLSPRDWN